MSETPPGTGALPASRAGRGRAGQCGARRLTVRSRCDDESVSSDIGFPPRRSREILQAWVDDYLAESGLNGARVDVVPQDGEDDLDTGLVIMRPKDSPLTVYMQPRAFDDPLWELTIPARDEDSTLSALELGAVAAVVLDAARLCTYLQFRSLEWDRSSGRR